MDGQLIRVRIIDGDELHTGIHQGRYECRVAGQPIELGDNQLGFLLFAGREGLHQLGPIIALPALDFGEFINQRRNAVALCRFPLFVSACKYTMPVYGQIKEARGFRQFLLRGIEKVKAEWAMACTAHNLRKLALAA